MSFSERESNVLISFLDSEKIKQEVKLVALVDLLFKSEIGEREAKEYLATWNLLTEDLDTLQEQVDIEVNNFNLEHPEHSLIGKEITLPKEQIVYLGTDKDTFIIDREQSVIEVKFDNVSAVSDGTLEFLKKKISSAELDILVFNNHSFVIDFHLKNGDYLYDEFIELASLYDWDSIEIVNPNSAFVIKKRGVLT